MSGNPRENAKNKGFWDGGSPGHTSGAQGAGRHSGFPGGRRSTRVGVRIDLERPDATPNPANPTRSTTRK